MILEVVLDVGAEIFLLQDSLLSKTPVSTGLSHFSSLSLPDDDRLTFEANIRIEIRKYRLYSSLPPFLSTCVCISNTKQLPIRFVRLLEPQPFTPRPPAARLRSCSSHVRLLLRRSSHGISGEFLCSRVRRAAVRIVCGCARFLPRISRGVRVCVRVRHVRVCMCAGWRSNNSWICWTLNTSSVYGCTRNSVIQFIRVKCSNVHVRCPSRSRQPFWFFCRCNLFFGIIVFAGDRRWNGVMKRVCGWSMSMRKLRCCGIRSIRTTTPRLANKRRGRLLLPGSIQTSRSWRRSWTACWARFVANAWSIGARWLWAKVWAYCIAGALGDVGRLDSGQIQ